MPEEYYLIGFTITILLIALFIFVYLRPSKISKKTQGLYFESSLGKIFYQAHGKKGYPLLLLHGIGASSYSWRFLIPLLEKNYKIVSVDLWGFGRSHKKSSRPVALDDQCEVLLELLDQLKIEKCHIIGSSMGGAIAFWLALKKKDRFNKIIAFAPAAHPSLVPQYLTRHSWLAKLTPWVLNRTLIKQILYSVYTNRDLVTHDTIEAYFEPYLDPQAHRTFADALKIIGDERVFNSLPKIENKTLIIWGEKDNIVPKSILDEIVLKHPNTQYLSHPTAGHHPMEEDPEWCADKIIHFLEKD